MFTPRSWQKCEKREVSCTFTFPFHFLYQRHFLHDGDEREMERRLKRDGGLEDLPSDVDISSFFLLRLRFFGDTKSTGKKLNSYQQQHIFVWYKFCTYIFPGKTTVV